MCQDIVTNPALGPLSLKLFLNCAIPFWAEGPFHRQVHYLGKAEQTFFEDCVIFSTPKMSNLL